jgi:hypothetical protein
MELNKWHHYRFLCGENVGEGDKQKRHPSYLEWRLM